MIRRTGLIAAKMAAVAAALVVLAVGLAWARLAAGPVDLPAFTHEVEAELSRARDGRRVGIDGVQLSWSGHPRALTLEARGVRLLDEEGQAISRYREVTVGISGLSLLIGRIALVRADFVGGDVTVTMKRDGTTEVAFGPPGSAPDIVLPPSRDDEPIEARVRKALDGLARLMRPVGPGGQLRDLTVRGARLRIVDEGGGGRWSADDASFSLHRDRRVLALAASARLDGAQGAAPATLRVTADTGFQSALIEFGARDARPRALLSPAMLGVFAGLDAPMTASITIGLDRTRGVTQFEGDVTLGRGGALMAGERFSLDGGRVHGRYDLEDDVLVVDELALAGSRTRIRGGARLEHASSLLRGDPRAPAQFDIALPSLTLDVPGVFAAPFELANVRAAGAVSEGGIALTAFEATRGTARILATGRMRFAEIGPNHDIYPGIQLDGRVEGVIDPQAVLALWPITFVESARSYLADALLGGRVSDVAVRINASPQEIAAGQLADSSLDLRFKFENANVRYIDTMSPLTAARGEGDLKGNSFTLTVADARLDTLAVSQGRVEIPRLYPKGAPITIALRGEGEARTVVGLLMQQPIALGDRMPLDPATIGGRGVVNLTLQRPNQNDVPYDQLRFQVDGRFDDVSGALRESGMALSNGRLRVQGDQRAITISGPMRLGASDVNVTWTERLGVENDPRSSTYQIAGVFDAADLDRLGYPASEAARGRIGVTVTGQGAGFSVDHAQIALDLRQAQAFMPSAFWMKAPGVAAQARFNVSRTPERGYALTDIDVRGAGLSVQGRAQLFEDGRLQTLDLPHFTLDGRADLAISGQRGGDGALEISARGPLFDGSAFVDADDGVDVVAQARAATAASTQAGHPPPRTLPIRIAVRPDRFALRGGAVMTNAHADVTLLDGQVQTLIVEGRSPGDKAVQLALGPRPADPQGRVAFRADDAGFAWRAFTGANNIVGGVATASGTWRMGPPSIAQVTMRLRDFRVVQAPAMAHLLGSVASLTGFVEALNGEGISFTSLTASVTMTPDQISFAQARMSGPSLGLTATGTYNTHRDNLDVDGVVVPSYGLNSMLGGVPILGDLLVSRRGEGVFGMTYSAHGPVAQPRVAVNPLSALTPGILRRIFEPLAPRPTPPPAQASAGAPPG